jgi:endonuclease YncB( thermonuclease family)
MVCRQVGDSARRVRIACPTGISKGGWGKGAGMSPRRSCALLGVVDSDTLRIEWEGRPRLVRLMDVCPEGARPGGERGPTAFGRKTRRYLKDVYLKGADSVELDGIHDTPMLSNSGKLLAYVFHGGQNINLRMVSEGWSPCFDKFGHPLRYCSEMYAAEQRACYEGRGVWGGLAGAGDYPELRRYWQLRAGQIESFRHARSMGEDVFCSRLHYREILRRAAAGARMDLFTDVASSFHLADGATLMQLGSPQLALCAYFPPGSRDLAGHVERCFIGPGKANYFYLSGALGLVHEQPQLVIEQLEQISACPPRTHPQPHPVEV